MTDHLLIMLNYSCLYFFETGLIWFYDLLLPNGINLYRVDEEEDEMDVIDQDVQRLIIVTQVRLMNSSFCCWKGFSSCNFLSFYPIALGDV